MVLLVLPVIREVARRACLRGSKQAYTRSYRHSDGRRAVTARARLCVPSWVEEISSTYITLQPRGPSLCQTAVISKLLVSKNWKQSTAKMHSLTFLILVLAGAAVQAVPAPGAHPAAQDLGTRPQPQPRPRVFDIGSTLQRFAGRAKRHMYHAEDDRSPNINKWMVFVDPPVTSTSNASLPVPLSTAPPVANVTASAAGNSTTATSLPSSGPVFTNATTSAAAPGIANNTSLPATLPATTTLALLTTALGPNGTAAANATSAANATIAVVSTASALPTNATATQTHLNITLTITVPAPGKPTPIKPTPTSTVTITATGATGAAAVPSVVTRPIPISTVTITAATPLKPTSTVTVTASNIIVPAPVGTASAQAGTVPAGDDSGHTVTLTETNVYTIVSDGVVITATQTQTSLVVIPATAVTVTAMGTGLPHAGGSATETASESAQVVVVTLVSGVALGCCD